MICTSILEDNYSDFDRKMKGESFVEIRLDRAKLSDMEIEKIFSRDIKTIATCRKDIYSDSKRRSILKKSVLSGADFIDIEIESDTDYLSDLISYSKRFNCKLIISFHDYDKTPSQNDLIKIVERGKSFGADIVKIAVKVNSKTDLERVVSLYSMGDGKTKIIAIGMGKLGRVSRVLANFFGAEITFASKDSKSKMTECQLTKEDLIKAVELID
ncbi:MAG: hypothetical protein CR982_02275 [Candidatus Cloacimonadota bacterium]|nr:MAG: hypothetical protein CR982_02275 [Candidatus Cloacimonadota bacterium]PIE81102.1 MAG: hypothetical protein CSA15_01115 [Candidatus Delongbacteria bacterium]